MQAYAIESANTEARILDLPTPAPVTGEVLVKVHAASINGFDLAVAAGMLEGAMEHRYPVVLGKDFAGTVEGVGDGVTGFVPGDPVFGVIMKPYLGDGSIAEYVTIPEAYGIDRLPDGLDMTTAGTLGLAGSAALAAIEAAGTISGETVFVSGGDRRRWIAGRAVRQPRWSNGGGHSPPGSRNGLRARNWCRPGHRLDGRRGGPTSCPDPGRGERSLPSRR
jgi:NADPH:quinone reductase-like Zn-dependent oxidoreductase